MVYTQLMFGIECTCLGMAPGHTFLLPGRVDVQSVDVTGLAVSNIPPAFHVSVAKSHSCMRHTNDE